MSLEGDKDPNENNNGAILNWKLEINWNFLSPAQVFQ